MPNLYAVHFDPVTWPEPEVFNPSRHLTEEGKLYKREELIPFSVGEDENRIHIHVNGSELFVTQVGHG